MSIRPFIFIYLRIVDNVRRSYLALSLRKLILTDLVVRNIDRVLYSELVPVIDLLEQYGLRWGIREYSHVSLLTEAIQLVFGYSQEQLKQHGREAKLVYARWIFFYHVNRLHPHYTYAEVGAPLGRSRSTVESSLKNFREQNNAYNPLLRDYADRVERYLNLYYCATD